MYFYFCLQKHPRAFTGSPPPSLLCNHNSDLNQGHCKIYLAFFSNRGNFSQSFILVKAIVYLFSIRRLSKCGILVGHGNISVTINDKIT